MSLANPFRIIAIGFILFCCSLCAQTNSPSGASSFNLQADQPGKAEFFGSGTATLFAKEVNESFNGILELSYVSNFDGKFPAGFVQASPIPQPWSGSMWTRDSGAFLRELTMWGYYQHACQMAECLMDLVGTNKDGFIAFPRYFKPGTPCLAVTR